MNPALIALLIAVRAACVALIQAINAFEVEPVQPEASKEQDASGACLHPETHRMKCPVMGYPERFMCTRCNTLQKGKDEQ